MAIAFVPHSAAPIFRCHNTALICVMSCGEGRTRLGPFRAQRWLRSDGASGFVPPAEWVRFRSETRPGFLPGTFAAIGPARTHNTGEIASRRVARKWALARHGSTVGGAL